MTRRCFKDRRGMGRGMMSVVVMVGLALGWGSPGLAEAAGPREALGFLQQTMPVTDACGLEQPSLLACGLNALNHSLNGIEAENYADIDAVFDADRQQLQIQAFLIGTFPATQRNCREILNRIRWDAGIDGRNGYLIKASRGSLYAYFFEPGRFGVKRAPNQLLRDLDSVTFVRVFMHDRDNQKVECSGPLVSKDIFY
ncbi:hypothetical protein [Roseospirillum parvum]|uniref:Uncharacterized protein n=1 Tax=Roseospirillum parvum TaxID=83401 RepID=A0A1G7YGR0_9PROT|nr:hypothetical protein [Roseospirillum parvum]SDG95772.1 hypothetical protein SAMN05421742_103303 [Roseospirillum parvum]